jgi:hypothetical protein
MRLTCPRYHRNQLAILDVYNTDMFDRKENSQVVSVADDLTLTSPERQKRDSLLKRRLIGVALIIGLALLGLAFPLVI